MSAKSASQKLKVTSGRLSSGMPSQPKPMPLGDHPVSVAVDCDMASTAGSACRRSRSTPRRPNWVSLSEVMQMMSERL